VRSLQAAVAALQALLCMLSQACGWRAHRVHLLGFSQVRQLASTHSVHVTWHPQRKC
jgi:hypothetical protein